MADIVGILLIGLKAAEEEFVSNYFAAAGHEVFHVDSADGAAKILNESAIDVVYLQSSNQNTAIEQVKQIRDNSPGLPVVMISEKISADQAVAIWHAGAADLIFPPLSGESFESSLKRALKLPHSGQIDGDDSSQVRLHYIDEAGEERWINLSASSFTIGRSSNNDLVLPQMNVSRSQVEIRMEGDEYIIKDMGSKHGTYLNGIRVEEGKLKHGDRIQVGGIKGQNLTFHQGDLLQSLLRSESKSEKGLSVHGFREMGKLLETLRELSSIPLLDDLLSLVVDTAIELTGAERGFIMLKDDKDELSFRCARNAYKSSLDGSSFKTSRRVPEEVFETGNRKVINDLDIDDSQDHSSTRRLGLRSISCVPLRYLTFAEASNLSSVGRVETIGVLYVDSQSVGAALSSTKIDALDTLASEAASAIYNARLYKESQEKRKLDEQLGIAREIQQALLPSPNKILPFVQAYSQNLPCYEVGGDYFDYFDLDEDKLGFALGDVAGKGIPASLLTSVIQGMLSAQTLSNLPLPAMMSNINKNLVNRGTGNRFVTFFFGILDPEGNCTYINAGHNPPLLLGQDGTLQELTEGGMVLGLFQAAEYDSATIKMKDGDHLVLFTDGVLEALNTTGEEFGEERLRALLQESATLPTEEILKRLHNAITSFSANTPQHDDITMMVLGFENAQN